MVFAVQTHEPIRGAGRIPYRTPPHKREATGSNPVAPTKFVQLADLSRTLIGDSGTIAGNHRCMLPDGKRVASGPRSIPLVTRTRRGLWGLIRRKPAEIRFAPVGS